MEKQAPKKKKTSNKGLFAALGVAVLLLAIIIVAVILFFQSPERQLASGFVNLVNAKTIGAKGTLTGTAGANTYTVDLDGTTDKKALQGAFNIKLKNQKGSSLDTKAQARVTQDGSLYIKLEQPEKFFDSYFNTLLAPSLGGQQESAQSATNIIRSIFTDLGKKVEGKWIKVTDAQFKALSSGEAGTSCYTQFSQTLQNDAAARNSLAAAYQKHQFVNIDKKLEAEGSSQGYRVTIDQAKLKEFKDSVADNAAVKKLGACGQDILTLGASDTLNDQTLDIWVERFSHNITRIKYEKAADSGASTVDLRLSYGVPVDVQTPSPVIDYDQLLAIPGISQ